MFLRSRRRGRRPPGLGFATAPRFSLVLPDLLLAGHGLLRALAGPGIGPGALAPHREAAPVAQTGVATDLHLALDVLGDFPAQVTLDLEVLVDPGAQPRHLFLGQIPDAGVSRDAGGAAHLLGARQADAVDVGEGDLEPLLPGDVDPGDPCHLTP